MSLFHLLATMLAILAFFLRLPREVRYVIWSLLMDVHAIDQAQEYRLTDTEGKVTCTAIPDHAYRPDRQLAFRIMRDPSHGYKRGVASLLGDLLLAHRQGRLQHTGTMLRINLHRLFTKDRRFLGRAKKIIMLALQLRMVTHIEFQTWEYLEEADFYYYKCVPFQLFLEHIAPCLRKNLRHVSITYDTFYKPLDEDQLDSVVEWDHSTRYYDTDIYADFGPPPTHVHDPNTIAPQEEPQLCLDWKTEIAATTLRGWDDHGWQD